MCERVHGKRVQAIIFPSWTEAFPGYVWIAPKCYWIVLYARSLIAAIFNSVVECRSPGRLCNLSTPVLEGEINM